jgi:hypothetical protein
MEKVMGSGRWRRHERAVARALGVRRLPYAGYGQPDCRVGGWAISILTRGTVPAWLWAALGEVGERAGDGERPAVVVTAVRQGVRLRRLVLLDFDQFAALVAAGGADVAAAEAAEGATEA